MMLKFLRGLKMYLTDIKNLAVHTVIGVGILLVAFYLPVPAWIRIGILILAVAGNITRMNLSKRRAAQQSLQEGTVKYE